MYIQNVVLRVSALVQPKLIYICMYIKVRLYYFLIIVCESNAIYY